jgi:hypothetical protein
MSKRYNIGVMVTPLIPVAPGTPFEAERYELIDGLQPDTRSLPLTRQNLVTSGSERTFMRETVRRATLANPPVLCLLAVDFGDGPVSLTLPMSVDSSGAPRTYLLETPGTVPGLELRMRLSSEDMRAEFSITTDYAGVSVDKVVSYARFAEALRREQGLFKVSRYHEGRPLHLATIPLPLPFDEEDRERARRDLHFWESVHEVATSTGTDLVCPEIVAEEDLRNLDRVLRVIRDGQLEEKVKEFAIPLPPDTVRNLVNTVEREGAVVEGLTLDFPNERQRLFGADIELGRCIRYVPKARLLNPLADMHKWLARDHRPGDSYKIAWMPIDDAPLRAMFPNWPRQPRLKPSRARGKDLEGVTRRAREFADGLAEARPGRAFSNSAEIVRADRDSRV